MGTGQHDRDEGDGAYGSREAAQGWGRSAAERAQRLGLATETMLDLANLVIGNRILDVAAGTGEQTMLAARRVGPAGSVLATDIAAEMLTIAAEAAHQAGLGNVTTRLMDAQHLDVEAESFDAAISRLGLMFIPDLPGALAGIRRALKPGGRLAAHGGVLSGEESLPRAPAGDCLSPWAPAGRDAPGAAGRGGGVAQGAR